MFCPFFKVSWTRDLSSVVMPDFSSFLRLERAEKILILHALLILPILQCCVSFLSLERIIHLFKLRQVALPEKHHLNCAPEKTQVCVAPLVLRLRKTVRIINTHLGWWPGKCLAQALFARSVLKRKKCLSILILGARHMHEDRQQKMMAHAWLLVNCVMVAGEQNEHDFIPVVAFV